MHGQFFYKTKFPTCLGTFLFLLKLEFGRIFKCICPNIPILNLWKFYIKRLSLLFSQSIWYALEDKEDCQQLNLLYVYVQSMLTLWLNVLIYHGTHRYEKLCFREIQYRLLNNCCILHVYKIYMQTKAENKQFFVQKMINVFDGGWKKCKLNLLSII